MRGSAGVGSLFNARALAYRRVDPISLVLPQDSRADFGHLDTLLVLRLIIVMVVYGRLLAGTADRGVPTQPTAAVNGVCTRASRRTC